MTWPLQKIRQTIVTKTVEIDDISLSLPYAEFVHENSIHRILITGGIDGDEYIGIEASYKLIDTFSKKKPDCTVTILPLVNIPGFLENLSQNPIDNKFPKHIYPGKINGSASEQLIHFLSTKFLHNVTLWIDLHAGALTEELTPFIWGYKTQNKSVNELTEHLLRILSPDKIIYDPHLPDKIRKLAQSNIAYLLLESGQKGERDTGAIKQHVTWVQTLIASLNHNVHLPKQSLSHAYNKVDEYTANKTGIWKPNFTVNKVVKKGQILGEIFSFEQKKIQTITAKNPGVILWMKHTMAIKHGEIIYGIARK